MASDREDRWDNPTDIPPDRGRTSAGPAPTGPGIALMISGILSLLVALVLIVVYVLMLDTVLDFMKQQEKQAAGAQKEQLQDQIKQIEENKTGVQTFYGVLGTVEALLSVVIILGGRAMMKAKGYTLAMIGSIVAIIPITSCCCLVATPVGIWAIMTLLNPAVKATFAANAAGGPGRDRDEYERDRGFER